MPLAAFPSISAKPLTNVQGQRDDNRIEFVTQVLSKMRLHSRAFTETQSLLFYMSTTDLATVEDFYESDLSGGTRMFTMTDPYNSVTSRYRFRAPLHKGGRMGFQGAESVFEVTMLVQRMP